MTDLTELKIFSTHPHECSYIEDQEATTIFVDPNLEVDTITYSQLSELGFRRSGKHLYRPHCAQCHACIPARVKVDNFKPSKQQRRTYRKNQDLVVTQLSSIDTPEHYQLYEDYICRVHSDGDMFPPSLEQYQSFLNCDWESTTFFEFREGEKLVAVAVTDVMANGLSSVYTFYDPLQPKRSLGVFGILFQIEEAKRLNLPSLYLGYWVKSCKKMSYKINYRPIELYVNNQWTEI